MRSIIITKKLKKRFTTSKGYYEAVQGVDLEVFEKEIFGFLGPNGAGKTTTLRMLTTLLPIDSGQAFVVGYDVKKEPKEVRKRIGYVSQQGGADKEATGLENLLLQAKLHGLSTIEANRACDQLISIFELNSCINRFVHTYSGGQQRRLDIALGMVHQPTLLFLDEPSTGLDPQNRANLWNQIKNLQKEGVAIFLTSHYLDEIDFLADRLAIMDHGKIITIGSPTNLKKEIGGDNITIGVEILQYDTTYNLLVQQSFIKEINQVGNLLKINVDKGEQALPHILRLLDQANISVQQIMLSAPTLDDVFLKKTGHELRNELIQ